MIKIKNSKNSAVMAVGLVLTILISNLGSFSESGKTLDHLRERVLRLHILANSDSDYDQSIKLKVRDAVLDADFFGGAEDLREAEETAKENLPKIAETAQKILHENGVNQPVSVKLDNMYFEKRVYGDITMPAGDYETVRIEIGKAEGHNWWCVMYPPLCVPMASEVTDDKSAEEKFFTEEELDILYKPEKYEIKFAIWDTIKSLIDKF